MTPTSPVRAGADGYRSSSAPVRATFHYLTSYSVTIAAARVINLRRERNRRMPFLRSLGRRVAHGLRQDGVRIHHFVPGMGIAFVSGAAALLTHDDALGPVLSVPFGVGCALTLDEVGILIDKDNPYWGSERLAKLQAALPGLAALGLGGAFVRRGRG